MTGVCANNIWFWALECARLPAPGKIIYNINKSYKYVTSKHVNIIMNGT